VQSTVYKACVEIKFDWQEHQT